MLSTNLISELQTIIREEAGLELEAAKIAALGESLVRIFEVLGKIAIPRNISDEK